MENRAHALAAGLFAIALGAATLLAVWWFSSQHQDVDTYHLVADGNVSGLSPQAQVRYRGMRAGRVTSIRLNPENPREILVDIEVESDIPVTRGTQASLGSQGVTGMSYIQLDDQGHDTTPLEPGERIVLRPGLMDQIAHTAFDVIHRFQDAADQLAGFFDEDNVQRFDVAMQHLESATAGIDRTFSEAPEAIESIRKALSDENIARLTRTLANLETATNEVSPAVNDIRELVSRAQSTMESIDSVTVSAGDTLIDGTLPQLNDLLEDLTQTSARLGRLIDDVDASPQILLRGRRDRQPGPGEAGFDRQ